MSDTALDLLTVSKVAELLNVSESEVYALCRSGKLQHFRIGTGRGTIRICREDLHSFLTSCRTQETQKPAAPTPERQAKIAIRPFKHIALTGVLAVPPDEGDRAADSNVNSGH
ncbi:helix-turn-helix domain-containing protein [Planctomicrobium piriforme]|uniref:DNA binding domain-containing protein, excisionase family n=1 Tax=Planctomicrobium piriforme TaxID=1576369 RepID=A0A1I3M5X7_9PLAN|nr:DNA binding domain-containing protein, excisionase family [Planctomicrobium piriforme]